MTRMFLLQQSKDELKVRENTHQVKRFDILDQVYMGIEYTLYSINHEYKTKVSHRNVKFINAQEAA